MILFPNCKINLGLHITRKREDGFHDLETIFYPVPLYDALEITRSPLSNTELSITGLELPGSFEGNICLKAYRLLKKQFPNLPAVNIHLHKSIPVGAGLGGGSADGAFALMLLNEKFSLGLQREQLLNLALQLGSDCPFFIINQPCFATGRGELLEPLHLDISSHQLVVINPGIHVSTAEAFGGVQPSDNRISLPEITSQPVHQWKDQLRNDFEASVFKRFPEIEKLKATLYQEGALYASMTGSGSTVFGIFPADAEMQFNFPRQYFVKIIPAAVS